MQTNEQTAANIAILGGIAVNLLWSEPWRTRHENGGVG